MADMSFLEIIVGLYRLAGRPTLPLRPIDIELQISYSETATSLINFLLADALFSKQIKEFEIDGEDHDESKLPAAWDELQISLALPNDGISRFHDSIEQLIKFNSLSEGIFPHDFYIIDIDYYSKDDSRPLLVEKVEKICNLISSLSKLAQYHDRKSIDGSSRLVFIQSLEGKSSTAIIIPSISLEILDCDGNDYSIADLLQDGVLKSDIVHIDERRGIFRNTLVEFFNENSYEFSDLIKKWNTFQSAYDSNLSVYLSGFHFHKARKDVASAEIEFSEKVSKALSELTSKVLAIPLSVIASLGMWKLEEFSEQSLVFIGLVLTSLMLHILIKSQRKQLKRISHARKLVFSPFEKKLTKYPETLRSEIVLAIKSLTSNERFTSRVLIGFYFLSWLPVLIGLIIFYLKK